MGDDLYREMRELKRAKAAEALRAFWRLCRDRVARKKIEPAHAVEILEAAGKTDEGLAAGELLIRRRREWQAEVAGEDDARQALAELEGEGETNRQELHDATETFKARGAKLAELLPAARAAVDRIERAKRQLAETAPPESRQRIAAIDREITELNWRREFLKSNLSRITSRATRRLPNGEIQTADNILAREKKYRGAIERLRNSADPSNEAPGLQRAFDALSAERTKCESELAEVEAGLADAWARRSAAESDAALE